MADDGFIPDDGFVPDAAPPAPAKAPLRLEDLTAPIPGPLQVLQRAGRTLLNMVKPGQRPVITPPAPPREGGETDKNYALRSARAALDWDRSPAGVQNALSLVSGTLPGGFGAGEGVNLTDHLPGGSSGMAGAVAEALEKKGINSGRSALSAQRTLALRQPIRPETILEADEAGAFSPIGRTKADAAERLTDAAQAYEDSVYGPQIEKFEQVGGRGFDKNTTADELRARGDRAFNNTGVSGIRDLYYKAANDLEQVKSLAPDLMIPESPLQVGLRPSSPGLRTPRTDTVEWGTAPQNAPPATPALSEAPPQPFNGIRFPQGSPVLDKWEPPPLERPEPFRTDFRYEPDTRVSFSQGEGLKRARQSLSKTAYEGMRDTLQSSAQKDIASAYREANENALESQRDLAPDVADAFIPSKEKMGRLIEARDAADVAAAREMNKHHVLSPYNIAAAVTAAGPAQALERAGAMHYLQTRAPNAGAWWAFRGRDLANFLGEHPQADARRAAMIYALRNQPQDQEQSP